MTLPNRGTCRSCKAPLIWATTEGGKLMPLDAEPSERGNVLLQGTQARVLDRELAVAYRAQGTPLYLSHFAECPDREKFRKPKGGAP